MTYFFDKEKNLHSGQSPAGKKAEQGGFVYRNRNDIPPPGILLVALLIFCFLLSTSSANAHPLGNFSINQYSGIRIGRDAVEVRYIIDMAEIPTFQEIQETGIAPSTSDSGVRSYVARKAEAWREGLRLEVNGHSLTLQTLSTELIFPPGAGGLPTLKIGVLYKATIPDSGNSSTPHMLNYRDDNFSGRAGWKEIVALADSSVRVVSSSVPQIDRSAELSNYPKDLLNSPPQDQQARVWFTRAPADTYLARGETTEMPANEQVTRNPNVQRSEKTESVGDGRGPPPQIEVTAMELRPVPDSGKPLVSTAGQLQADRQSIPRDSFTQLIEAPHLGSGIVLVALAIALGLGAFHALEPGHGKTLVAAYLVGSKGTMTHAFLLGLIVTAAHTAGVYLLGGVTLYASHYIVPERLYPALGLFSGAMIIATGTALLIRHYRGKRVAASRHHNRQEPRAHRHEHCPGHEHFNGHQHRPHDHSHGTASLRELFTLGISGGIVPCPGALVVLLSAVSMNRLGFGLLLIVAFSAGLAAVLIGIGLLVVSASRFTSRFHKEGHWVTRWLPITSSGLIVVLGAALVCQALQTKG